MRDVCPDCDEPLVAYELRGIEIDRCLSCGGTWLDTGELEQIALFAGADAGRLGAACAETAAGPRSRRRCPRCRRRLRNLRLPQEDTIVLDTCPLGHGLWFDRGEMHAVIAAHADAEEEAVGHFFGELYPSETTSPTEGEGHV